MQKILLKNVKSGLHFIHFVALISVLQMLQMYKIHIIMHDLLAFYKIQQVFLTDFSE